MCPITNVTICKLDVSKNFETANLIWVNYKIECTGTVSTIIKDTQNKNVVMFAPEAPEVFFHD